MVVMGGWWLERRKEGSYQKGAGDANKDATCFVGGLGV